MFRRFNLLCHWTRFVLLFLVVVGGLWLALELPDPRLQLLDHHNFLAYSNVEPDRLLGYRLRRNVISHGFRQNSLGFVGPEIALPKPPNTFRIFCLGGSTTMGVGVDADRYSYPVLLQQMLRKISANPGENIEIVNAGVFGYNSIHTALRITRILDSYQPDMYIIMDGLNDLDASQALPMTKLARLRQSIEIQKISKQSPFNLLDVLEDKLSSMTIFSMLREFFLKEEEVQERGYGLNEVDKKIEILGYRKNLQAAIDHAKSRGIPTVLVDDPMRIEIRKNKEAFVPPGTNTDFAELLSRCAGKVYADNRLLTKENDIPLVDTHTVFDQFLFPGGAVSRVWADDLHLSRYGNYLLAREICRKLMSMPEIQKVTQATCPLADGIFDKTFQEIWK